MIFDGHSFDESLSYTDTKGNPQTVKVSNVLKKCAKAGHVWCDICQCEFLYLSNFFNEWHSLIEKGIIQTTHSTMFLLVMVHYSQYFFFNMEFWHWVIILL